VLGTYYLVNQPVGGVAAPVFGSIAGAIGIGFAYNWLAVVFLLLSAVALIAAWPTARALRQAPS
jgi:membrane protein implicated in regulation of membrane protease activity